MFQLLLVCGIFVAIHEAIVFMWSGSTGARKWIRITLSTVTVMFLSPCWFRVFFWSYPIPWDDFTTTWYMFQLFQFYAFARATSLHHAVVRMFHVVLVFSFGQSSSVFPALCVAYDYTDWMMHVVVSFKLPKAPYPAMIWVYVRLAGTVMAFGSLGVTNGWFLEPLGLFALLGIQMYLFSYLSRPLQEYAKAR